MAFTINKSFDLTNKILPLMVQQLRFRNRPNLQRPLPMHYKRKRLIAVCEPVLRPTTAICENILNAKETTTSIVDENPFALYMAGKLRRDFAKHPMVAIFHTDSYTGSDFQKIRLMFHDNNFPIQIQERVNRQVSAAAFEGTRWSPLIPLFQSRTAIGFCGNKEVSKMMKLLKKFPAFILIALVYENRILHRDDVDRVVKLNNNILTLHSQLSSSLNQPTMSLTQNLIMSQVSLTNSLATYSKGSSDSKDDSSSSSSSDSDSDSSSSDSDNEEVKPS